MLKFGNKEFRNLQEQVEDNMKDIANLKMGEQVLSEFGIKVVGQELSVDDMPTVVEYKADNPDWSYGDAYAIGEEAPYTIYILTRENDTHEADYWFDIGLFPEPGPQGEQGPQGVQGIQGIQGIQGPAGTNGVDALTYDTIYRSNSDPFGTATINLGTKTSSRFNREPKLGDSLVIIWSVNNTTDVYLCTMVVSNIETSTNYVYVTMSDYMKLFPVTLNFNHYITLESPNISGTLTGAQLTLLGDNYDSMIVYKSATTPAVYYGLTKWKQNSSEMIFVGLWTLTNKTSIYYCTVNRSTGAWSLTSDKALVVRGVDVKSGSATAGQVLTADGNGSASWQDVGGDAAVWGNITGTLSNQTDLANALDGKQNLINLSNKLSASYVSGLANVATSGSYNDLTDKPSIPAAQVQSDYAQTNSSAVDYIKNKPDLSVYALSANLANVATTGDYDDLLNKPTIPAAQVQSDWAQNNSSAVDYIKNKPNIPDVSDMVTIDTDQTITGEKTFTEGVLLASGSLVSAEDEATGILHEGDGLAILATSNNDKLGGIGISVDGNNSAATVAPIVDPESVTVDIEGFRNIGAIGDIAATGNISADGAFLTSGISVGNIATGEDVLIIKNDHNTGILMGGADSELAIVSSNASKLTLSSNLSQVNVTGNQSGAKIDVVGKNNSSAIVSVSDNTSPNASKSIVMDSNNGIQIANAAQLLSPLLDLEANLITAPTIADLTSKSDVTGYGDGIIFHYKQSNNSSLPGSSSEIGLAALRANNDSTKYEFGTLSIGANQAQLAGAKLDGESSTSGYTLIVSNIDATNASSIGSNGIATTGNISIPNGSLLGANNSSITVEEMAAKSTVSGTNDGTNWTAITIDGISKNIPAGGGSAPENMVTTNTSQEITAGKQFSGSIDVDEDFGLVANALFGADTNNCIAIDGESGGIIHATADTQQGAGSSTETMLVNYHKNYDGTTGYYDYLVLSSNNSSFEATLAGSDLEGEPRPAALNVLGDITATNISAGTLFATNLSDGNTSKTMTEVLAGGGSEPANMVTTNTSQTITGIKKIITPTTVNNTVLPTNGLSFFNDDTDATYNNNWAALGVNRDTSDIDTRLMATVKNSYGSSGIGLVRRGSDAFLCPINGTVNLGSSLSSIWKWNDLIIKGNVSNGTNSIGIADLIARNPAPSSTDGTYVLKCTVASGTPTYSWVLES